MIAVVTIESIYSSHLKKNVKYVYTFSKWSNSVQFL